MFKFNYSLLTFSESELIAPWYETNEEAKAKLKATLESETIPLYLDKLESWAKENNGHLALSKVYVNLFCFNSI